MCYELATSSVQERLVLPNPPRRRPRGYPQLTLIGSLIAPHVVQPDGSFQDANGKAAAPWGGPTVKFAKLAIAEAVKGSKENAECSNRGLCDYTTGLCKCFQGYTDFDCSIQHALGPR